MLLSFRWFGPSDPVPLAHIRQVPGIEGIVTALYDVPTGETWPKPALAQLLDTVQRSGFQLSVIESIPVHEDVKLGRAQRDRWIDNYCASITHLGELGIGVLCYNFMPVFDWMRTTLALKLADGSTTLAYDDDALHDIDLARGTFNLPGWAEAYDSRTLAELLVAYRGVTEDQLWENLEHFLQRVVPVAHSAGVKLALHPDDPPWSVFGLPRIITNAAALARVIRLSDSPANGITFCTGSLGALAENDLPAMIRALRGRIHFAHCRNVRRTAERSFYETPHPSRFGDVDMLAVLSALHDIGFSGPLRPDHGRMIWKETGRPGYGLNDRALGAMYLQGLWEGISG